MGKTYITVLTSFGLAEFNYFLHCYTDTKNQQNWPPALHFISINICIHMLKKVKYLLMNRSNIFILILLITGF